MRYPFYGGIKVEFEDDALKLIWSKTSGQPGMVSAFLHYLKS
jgi:hypothetical protein